MKAATVISVLLRLLITMPIWYYLLYKVLQLVEATELMWFLFWVYMPVAAIAAVIDTVVSKADKK